MVAIVISIGTIMTLPVYDDTPIVLATASSGASATAGPVLTPLLLLPMITML